ncbi:hypothetical protein Tco_0943661 [Tanacetum coccineum]
MMEKMVIRENRQRVLVRKRIERIGENKNRKRAVWNKNRHSDLVSKRIERNVNAARHKLNTAGINLLLLLKVNAARHNLLLLVTVNAVDEQFWSTVKAKTVNGEVQLHALVDGKKIIITESTVRRDLQLEDAEGVDCLPNSTIFEQLTLMGSKTTAWNEFSSTMASAIICLATNQKFNFSKYIFERVISIDYVTSKDNIADPFTKGLSRELVIKSSKGMGLKPLKENLT